MPRKVKHRKQQRGRLGGPAKGGSEVTFGDFGIQALEPAWLTARQIEAARIAMTRHVKRGGKVWIRVFPDRPVTQKPAETRMGSGKGNPEHWVAVVKPGRILFELAGVEPQLAAGGDGPGDPEAAVQGAFRDPARDPRHAGGAGLMATAAEIADYDTEELERQLSETRRELFNLRFQLATGQLDNSSRIGHVRRDVARMMTELRIREIAEAEGMALDELPGHRAAARRRSEDERLGRDSSTAAERRAAAREAEAEAEAGDSAEFGDEAGDEAEGVVEDEDVVEDDGPEAETESGPDVEEEQ